MQSVMTLVLSFFSFTDVTYICKKKVDVNIRIAKTLLEADKCWQ